MKKQEEIKTCWLVFCAATHWVRGFLHKDIGHVFMVIRDDYNWILVNHQMTDYEGGILPYERKENVPSKLVKMGYRVLEVKYKRCSSIMRLPVILQCVTLVKFYLGIRLWAFTPYRLYKRLMKMGKNGRYKSNILSVKYIT